MTLIKKPESYFEINETLMSNLDGTIDREVEKEIVNGDYFGQYAAWDFCGYVWHQDGSYCCEVWVYGTHVETIKEDSLEEIMIEASSKYGNG